jgi:hypothetical protein
VDTFDDDEFAELKAELAAQSKNGNGDRPKAVGFGQVVTRQAAPQPVDPDDQEAIAQLSERTRQWLEASLSKGKQVPLSPEEMEDVLDEVKNVPPSAIAWFKSTLSEVA